jgi:hypothetical protein
MSKKRSNRKINARLIKSKSSYYINELARTIDVCAGTVRNMTKEGLPIIKGSYPILIHGQDAIDFIKAKQERSKKPLEDDEFQCFGCRTSTKAKGNLATLEYSAPKVGNLKAFCPVCGTRLNRRISLCKLPEFQKVLKIQQLHNPRLI